MSLVDDVAVRSISLMPSCEVEMPGIVIPVMSPSAAPSWMSSGCALPVVTSGASRMIVPSSLSVFPL
jgi:hypothetical protein